MKKHGGLNMQGQHKILLDQYKADPNNIVLLRPDEHGKTLLHIVCETNDPEGIIDDLIAEIVKIGHGRGLALKDSNDNTPFDLLRDPELRKAVLFKAAETGYDVVVEQLILSGKKLKSIKADCLAVTDYGFTALHIAAENGHANIIVLLLARDDDGLEFAEVNKVSEGGFTALHIAAYAVKKDAVVALIAGNANINAVTEDNETPLMRLLSTNGNSEHVPVDKLIARNELALFFLSQSVIDENEISSRKSRELEDTYLMLAIANNFSDDVLKAILNKTKDRSSQNLTAGKTYILDHPRKQDQMVETTALHLAISLDRLMLIPLLKKKGAVLNIHDLHGYTPLQLMIVKGGFGLDGIKLYLAELSDHEVAALIKQEQKKPILGDNPDEPVVDSNISTGDNLLFLCVIGRDSKSFKANEFEFLLTKLSDLDKKNVLNKPGLEKKRLIQIALENGLEECYLSLVQHGAEDGTHDNEYRIPWNNNRSARRRPCDIAKQLGWGVPKVNNNSKSSRPTVPSGLKHEVGRAAPPQTSSQLRSSSDPGSDGSTGSRTPPAEPQSSPRTSPREAGSDTAARSSTANSSGTPSPRAPDSSRTTHSDANLLVASTNLFKRKTFWEKCKSHLIRNKNKYIYGGLAALAIGAVFIPPVSLLILKIMLVIKISHVLLPLGQAVGAGIIFGAEFLGVQAVKTAPKVWAGIKNIWNKCLGNKNEHLTSKSKDQVKNEYIYQPVSQSAEKQSQTLARSENNNPTKNRVCCNMGEWIRNIDDNISQALAKLPNISFWTSNQPTASSAATQQTEKSSEISAGANPATQRP